MTHVAVGECARGFPAQFVEAPFCDLAVGDGFLEPARHQNSKLLAAYSGGSTTFCDSCKRPVHPHVLAT